MLSDWPSSTQSASFPLGGLFAVVPEHYKNISLLWLQSPELIPSKKYTTTRGSMTSARCSPGLRSLPGCLCRPSRLLRPRSCAASQMSWRALCNQTNTIFETVRRGYGWQRQAIVILEKKIKKIKSSSSLYNTAMVRNMWWQRRWKCPWHGSDGERPVEPAAN